MAQVTKVDLQREYNCPADKLFEIFTSKTSLIPNICPDKVKSVEVLQGDGGTVGSIRRWTCLIENSEQSATERIKAIDKNNKSVTFEVLDGDMTKHHKAIKFKVHFIPKGNGCLMNWSMENEKLNSSPFDLKKQLQFSDDLRKDIAAFLEKA